MREPIQKVFKKNPIVKSVLFCVAFTGIFMGLSFAKNTIPHSFERLGYGIIGTIAGFMTSFIFLRFDRKKFSDIGLVPDGRTWVKFLGGVLAGIAVMGLMVTGVLYFTHTTIEVNPGSHVLKFMLMTLPLIPLAFMEELGFRAYPLEILKNKTGIRQSLFITTFLFAVYHIFNGWTVASSFYGPGVWGLLFGLAAIYSNGIAMSTGMHYAANLTTSAFGTANSAMSIWIIRQNNLSENQGSGIDWAVILPAFFLLVFAILCIEWYVRRRQ